MKERIKIDTAILFGIIFLTLILFQFPRLYPRNIILIDILSFLGLWVVLTGTFFRMSARAHKKANSDQGHGLVRTGPYKLVRNPMYLGTFLTGVGFILVVWPLYLFPIFVYFFFTRFNIQIHREESYLHEMFGKEYEAYVHQVSRMIPSLKNLKGLSFKSIFPLKETWGTKERYGVLYWPLLILFLDMYAQHIIFGSFNLVRIVLILSLSFLSFWVVLWILYRNE